MRCRKLKIDYQGVQGEEKQISRGCETPALCFVIDLIQKMTLRINGYDLSRQVPKGNNLPSCTDSTPLYWHLDIPYTQVSFISSH